MNGVRFASKQYPKLDDDGLYDLLCNLNFQLQHRQPHGTVWLGYMGMQYPQDLISYQEILYDVKPQLIIETGTGGGGCTLFFASVLDSMIISGRIKDYRIVTIDYMEKPMQPTLDMLKHPRIVFVNKDSLNPETVQIVKTYWNPDVATMVFLDSSHGENIVSAEMELYGSLVSVSSYMVVEDTCLGYYTFVGNGPLHAVKQFLEKHDGWIIDRFPERWLCTQHPCGWLRRTK